MKENEFTIKTHPWRRAISRFLPPAYGCRALLAMAFFNIITYFGSRLFTSGWYHYSMETALDKAVPYVKEFIIVYIPVSYLQWAIGYYMISRDTRENCNTLIGAEIIGKILCLICFLLLPTTMVRENITGTDFLNRCVRYLYEVDPADNLFPSIHCLDSWIIFRSTFYLKSLPRWAKPLHLIISLLVFASTLFVKQHVIVDVFGGIIVAEIGLLIMTRVIRKH